MLDLLTKIKQKYVVKHKISMNTCFNAYFLFAEKRGFLLGMKFNVQHADNKSLTMQVDHYVPKFSRISEFG